MSDSHSYWDRSAEKYLEAADEIWHAGDFGSITIYDNLMATGKTIRAVYGNIDGGDLRHSLPERLVWSVEGLKICMTHIGGYPSRYNQHIIPWLKTEKPHAFVCGHSHILRVMYDSALQFLSINPGAAGNYGAQKVRTILSCAIDENRFVEMNVIELGPKKV